MADAIIILPNNSVNDQLVKQYGAGSIYFQLPPDPQQIGLLTPDSSLRSLDFSGLDFDTARQVLLEYIKTYFPDKFNDFVAANGIVMMTELVASAVAKLSLRSDLLAQEATLATATQEESVLNHLSLINQKILRQTAATVDFECVVSRIASSDIRINAGTSFNIAGADGKRLIYEVYKAPDDWTSQIIIPSGKKGTIAFGIEGQFTQPVSYSSDGTANQSFTIRDNNILSYPVFIKVSNGRDIIDYTAIDYPIQKAGPNDTVAETIFYGDRMVVNFGDNRTGKIPASGSSILIRYRVGGGLRGRISANTISQTNQYVSDPPQSLLVNVTFSNVTSSQGGTDKESIEDAKRRAPKDFSLHDRIVTISDYSQFAKTFASPVYGAVAKATAICRTDINANLVEVYILAFGKDALELPSLGLRDGLSSKIRLYNNATDTVEVLGGRLKAVDIKASIIISRTADGTIVRQEVERTINEFFNYNNWELGEGLFLSNFINTLEGIDGIQYVDMYAPNRNILATNEVFNEGTGTAGHDPYLVGLNELISLGNSQISYFYEKVSNQPTVRS